MSNHYLKDLRDRIATCPDPEEKSALQQEWDLVHMQLEALKAEDERNYVGFGE